MIRIAVFAASFAITLAAFGQSPELKRGDGQPDGKKSLGGSGEMVAFKLVGDGGKVSGIKIHASRYGTPEAPKENFLIYFLSKDESEILRTEMAPYSLLRRGPEQWVDVKFSKPVSLPKEFWIALDFRAGRTKGAYVSFDTSTAGRFSRIGLPGMESKETDFSGDWMVEVDLAE